MADQRRNPGGAPEPVDIATELRNREPIFHRSGPGTVRADLEAMTADDFWEVGASGRVYDRATVLEVVAGRYADPGYDPMAGLVVSDFDCHRLDGDTWLVTYHLMQDERATRRMSIWRWTTGGWTLRYHQGTVISG